MMKDTAKRFHLFPAIAAILLGLAIIAAACPALAGAVDSDHLEAYFKAKFGYADTEYYRFSPTMLNYVCFSHYISRDFGVLDDDHYVLYGGVSQQQVTDYIAYLNRFGYRTAFDALQGDTRYVDLRDVDAPDYLPQVFRFYYFPEEKAIVTIESIQIETAFDQACTQHWADYTNEIYYNLNLLQPGLSVSLEEVREEEVYLWADADNPFCSYASAGMNQNWYGNSKLEKVLDDGSRFLVMNSEYKDANQNQMYFWLLRLEFTSSDQPFDPEDWEFCIADDGLCVYFPLQLGNQLTETDNGLVLRMDPALYTGSTYTLWLSFPMYYGNPWDFARLYIAPAGAGTPIMERVNIGFDRPEEETEFDGIDWSTWDF